MYTYVHIYICLYVVTLVHNPIWHCSLTFLALVGATMKSQLPERKCGVQVEPYRIPPFCFFLVKATTKLACIFISAVNLWAKGNADDQQAEEVVLPLCLYVEYLNKLYSYN